jgi:RHH-type transcriptional regulator, rel operon repressor / antitoxin RelB
VHGPVEKRTKRSKSPIARSRSTQKQAAGVVRIPAALDERLTRLAQRTGRSKSYYASKALDAFIEDTEDYLLAVASYESTKKTISLEELRKKYKLQD